MYEDDVIDDDDSSNDNDNDNVDKIMMNAMNKTMNKMMETTKELKERIEMLIDMEQRSGSMAPITPLYVSRMLNVPLEEVEKAMKGEVELKIES